MSEDQDWQMMNDAVSAVWQVTGAQSFAATMPIARAHTFLKDADPFTDWFQTPYGKVRVIIDNDMPPDQVLVEAIPDD